MRVAVSQRVDYIESRNETRDSVDQKLVKLLLKTNLRPFLVPNVLIAGENLNENGVRSWLSEMNPEGIVLSGGNNIGSNPDRDATESTLLDYAQQMRIPVLGICRGMQMMGVWAGVKLKPVTGHVQVQHQLQGIKNRKVNSFHNLSLAKCPLEFDVLAESEDGCIEAIRHKELPWEGWMWHPEREVGFSDEDVLGIKNIFHI